MSDVLSQFLAALVRFIFSNWLTGLALVALIAYLVYSTSKDKTKDLLTILRQIKSDEWKEFLQTKCTQGKTCDCRFYVEAVSGLTKSSSPSYRLEPTAVGLLWACSFLFWPLWWSIMWSLFLED